MRYHVECNACHESLLIRGSYDPSVNALELDDSDSNWEDACEHIKDGGDYTIGEGESDDED